MDVKDYDRALEGYRAEWQRTHRRPKRRRPHLIDFAQFLMFLPIAAIGPIVSAFRTMALIGAHTAFQKPWVVWLETALGTFLFEWGVIAFQVQRLRREMGNKRKLPEIGTGWIWVGVATTIGAVAVSNTVEIGIDALEKAGYTVPSIIPALAIGIFLGLGVIIISAIAGEVVGRFILEYQVEDRKLRAQHAGEVREWEEQFVRSWDRVKKKRLAAISRPVAANNTEQGRGVATGLTVVATGEERVAASSKAVIAGGKVVAANEEVAATGDEVVAANGEVIAASDEVVDTSGEAVAANGGDDQYTSEAMAGHVSKIRETVIERVQRGGNGTFKRRDVERWQGVSPSQANNILRYGVEHQLIELVNRGASGYKYRFVDN